MNQNTGQRLRIGDLLVAQQYISPDQLDLALKEQKNTGQKLGRTLISLGLIEEDTLLELLSRQLNYPYVELQNFRFDTNLVAKLPETIARRYRVMLLSEAGDHYTLGMSDPTDLFCLDEIARHLDKTIKPAIVRESELLDMLDLAYSGSEEIALLAEELDSEMLEADVDLTDIITDATDEDAPVVKLLQKIFENALKNKASDIHIEPDETVLRIRERIDGVLNEQVMNEKRIASALVVRLKLMSGLNISEKRLPQDGRFNLRVKNRNIDVRLSTMPVQFGESVVMRILDHTDGMIGLDKVGMPSTMVSKFRSTISKPHGLVLVTGPTGSGKTTTLYGALSELNTADRKIITVEDPVEYRLPRISQVQVNEKIGLNFETVLRATLRQDPDVLLVGEIRDGASAEIALRAAMTGHMVLSTLHTNDAVTSALRLIDMDVDPYLVASSLRAVIAQRLVRRVCNSCGAPYTPSASERHLVKHLSDEQLSKLKKGTGCPHCFNSGYRGRVGVFEFLEVNQSMADALRASSVSDFNNAAHQNGGYRPLGASALDYALEGITTLEEVMRVSAMVEDETLEDAV